MEIDTTVEKIEGETKKIIYHSEKTHYTVMVFKTKE